MPAALCLTDAQLSAVHFAARPLQPSERTGFLEALAARFAGRQELGDGELHRAIVVLQRAHFTPPMGSEIRPPLLRGVKA
jgi:hypothetical protein